MSCYISFLQTFDTLRFLIQYSVFKVQCNLVKFKALKACFHKLLIFQDYSVPARDRATFVARCIVSAAKRREYLVDRCLRKAIVSAQISNAVFRYSALLSALLDFNTDIKFSFPGREIREMRLKNHCCCGIMIWNIPIFCECQPKECPHDYKQTSLYHPLHQGF